MFYAYKTFMPLERLMRLNTKESLWLYVIYVLKDQPMHAYALKKEIEKRFHFRSGNVTVYKVLYLLQRGGYVTKQKEGRRVIYSITETGIKALDGAKDFYKKQVDRL